MNFDQLMAIYNHYEVIASKITVQFLPNGDQFYCGVSITADGNFTGTPTTAMEQRGTRFKYQSTLATRPTVVKLGWSSKRTFGKKAVGANPNLKGGITSNPTEQSVFQVWQAGVAGADPVPVVALVLIEFIAIFSELKVQNAS